MSWRTAPVVGSKDIRFAESVRGRSMRQLHAALAQVASAPCDLVGMGDSIMEGLDATAIGAAGTRWIDLLRDYLRARWQPGGVTGGAGYLPIYQPFVASSWTSVTGASDLVAHGLGKKAAVFSAGGHGATLVFTGTGLDIIYTKGNGYGTFSWAIDGGLATNVNTNSGGAETDGWVVQIRGLSDASHTLVLARVSGAVIVDGAMVYRGDEAAGIRMWDAGHGGHTASVLNGTSANYWRNVIATIQPDLVMICFGTNEYSGVLPGDTPTALTTNLLAIMTAIRAQCTVSPSFLLIVPPQRGDVVAPLFPWSQYVAAIYAAARADGYAGVLDMGQRFDTDPLTPYHASVGLIHATNKVHPLDLGHAVWAQAVNGYLQP